MEVKEKRGKVSAKKKKTQIKLIFMFGKSHTHTKTQEKFLNPRFSYLLNLIFCKKPLKHEIAKVHTRGKRFHFYGHH